MKALLWNLLATSLLLGAPTAVDAALVDCTTEVAQREIDNTDNSVCFHFGGGADNEIYIDWFNGEKISETYPNYVFLQGSDPQNPDSGAAVHWAIDGDYVLLAVAAKATGWVGFGLAEAGGMLGADMVLWEAANPNELIDAYTTDEKFPLVDECSNDWELIEGKEEDGFLFLETRRLLDTGDSQDRAIINDKSRMILPHRVIAAWGDSEKVGFHGLNRARGAIRFFGDGDNQKVFDIAMDRAAEGSFTVQSLNHEISTDETEYSFTCVSRDDFIAQGVPDSDEKLYLIGFEPFVQSGNEAYVHHYLVYGYTTAECPRSDSEVQNPELVYAWAPGGHPWALPDLVGMPFNAPGEFQSFHIQVHYNNILNTAGVIDSSGSRLYWTSQPRESEMGIFSIADPFVSLHGKQVGNGLSRHDFECPASCSAFVLGDQPVTVMREYLHMHRTGAHVTNQQIRNGEVIRTGTFDYWDFDQNGNGEIVQDPFVVEPGDAFRTSCFYDGDENTRFGLGSQEEMCIAFLSYYPRQKMAINTTEILGVDYGIWELPWVCSYQLDLAVCSATYELSAVDDVDHIFGVKDDECPLSEESSDEQSDDTDGSFTAAGFTLLVGAMTGFMTSLLCL